MEIKSLVFIFLGSGWERFIHSNTIKNLLEKKYFIYCEQAMYLEQQIMRNNYYLIHLNYYLKNKDFNKIFRPKILLHIGDNPIKKNFLDFFKNFKKIIIHLADDRPIVWNHYQLAIKHTFHCSIDSHPINERTIKQIVAKALSQKNPQKELKETSLKTAKKIIEIKKLLDQKIQNSYQKNQKQFNQHQFLIELARHIARGKTTSAIFCGNSTAIRNWTKAYPFCQEGASGQWIANRGVSGIDGNLATAWGGLYHHNKMVVIIGDMSLQHDLSSLFYNDSSLSTKNIYLFCINNCGGQIFSQLKVAKYLNKKELEDLFILDKKFPWEKITKSAKWEYYQIKDKQSETKHLKKLHSTFATLGKRLFFEVCFDPKSLYGDEAILQAITT